MLRIPHCADNQQKDGGKVVSPKPYSQAALYSSEALFFFFWHLFLLEAENTKT
jgi:hypothetical protein